MTNLSLAKAQLAIAAIVNDLIRYIFVFNNKGILRYYFTKVTL